ncbi:hypothetical protein [Archangium primigenium]|uniref:hypothetical protein n=1 Tax=[Archangium] primigenium TaxID=2792470 RepID=UPI00195CEBE2|nr:hypothetical protein [Archangium primigenium]MBM7118284.1 hypothetical protein [Archangium primigenium]
MKTHPWLVLALTLLPVAAPHAAEPDGAERAQKQARMKRVLSLAEDLELNEAQALKMAETMRQFDERRLPLLRQVHASAQVLRRAAKGDASLQAQVDQAVQQVFDARAQLTALERELYQTLARELPPQKRAQLAIFLARNDGKMKWRKGDRD